MSQPCYKTHSKSIIQLKASHTTHIYVLYESYTTMKPKYLRSLFQSPRQSLAQSSVTGFQSGDAVSKIHSDRYTCKKFLFIILNQNNFDQLRSSRIDTPAKKALFMILQKTIIAMFRIHTCSNNMGIVITVSQ